MFSPLIETLEPVDDEEAVLECAPPWPTSGGEVCVEQDEVGQVRAHGVHGFTAPSSATMT